PPCGGHRPPRWRWRRPAGHTRARARRDRPWQWILAAWQELLLSADTVEAAKASAKLTVGHGGGRGRQRGRQHGNAAPWAIARRPAARRVWPWHLAGARLRRYRLWACGAAAPG